MRPWYDTVFSSFPSDASRFSRKGPLPSVRKPLWGIRNISVRGAGRSPNPASEGSSSNARNPIPDHILQAGVILTLCMHCIWSLFLQDPPADAAPAPKQNTGQATNSGTAKVGLTDVENGRMRFCFWRKGFFCGHYQWQHTSPCVDACHQAIIPESRNPVRNGCVLPRLACTESIDCEIGEYVICRYMID